MKPRYERGPTLRVIRHEITVNGRPAEVEATWPHFVRWVLSGRQRLACDQLACLDAVSAGLVSFAPAEDDRCTVAFSLDAEGGGGRPEGEFETMIARDLVVFKDYVERVHPDAAAARLERTAQAEADVRRDRRASRERISERGGTSFTDRFPT